MNKSIASEFIDKSLFADDLTGNALIWGLNMIFWTYG